MTRGGKDGGESHAEQLRQAIRLKRAAARSRTPEQAPDPGGERLEPRPANRDARLGELQRSLWLLQQLEPGSPSYHLASAFRVPGALDAHALALDAHALERGLNGVVSRHRLLRSTFSAHRDGVRQVIHPHAPIGIERVAAGPGEALAAAVREARRPFDLETGPLIRLLWIDEPAASEGLLVLVLHHILADERSLGQLWRELARGYDGRASGTSHQPQYDDWVHWMAGRDGPRRAADLAFWRRRLEPLPDDLALPFERPVSETRGARGRLLSRPLGPGAWQGIRRVASATGTTPFVVFAFAFRLLLHRYTEGRDVAFATPVSTRSHPDTAEMIGYFLNPVVVRVPIDEGLPLKQAIGDFGRRLRDLLAHASVPFHVLVEELAPPRRPDRHPVFQTMFVYQETPPPPELGGVRLEPVTLDLGESKFDLTLFAPDVAAAGARAIEIAVEYRADRFDEVWMRNLLSHYATLIGHLAASLERPVAGVPMLSGEESEKLRGDAQGPPLDVASSPLLPRQILGQARRSGRDPAVLGGDETWSYGELSDAAARVARELARRGVGPGDRVALFVDRSPRLIAALLGCHWAGAAYVPLDPAYPSARNREVLADAEAAAVLTRAGLRDLLPADAPPAIDVDRLESRGPDDWTLPDLDGEHPAYLLYTSGSTGRPRGVVVTHGNLRASNGARRRVYDMPLTRFLLLPSVAFDSSVAGIFGTLATGGALVVPADDEVRDPRRLARRMIETRVTSLLTIPSLYAHLLAAGGTRLRDLEVVIVAGESCLPPLVKEHFRLLPDARLFNEYGPTEATVWATAYEMERRDGERPVAIGRPIPGVTVEVLDALGRRVPAGIPGQGWISGPTLAAGYWRRRDLTDERFVRHFTAAGREERRYRTGDRLSRTADGRLLFLGRVDEQIKLRGFRIEPGEIEAALLELPGIEEAAVVARDPAQLVAFVETTGAGGNRREELAKRLPEYMVPSRIVALRELPRLPNGKVDRGRLREMPLAAEPEAADGAPMPTYRERALVSLWQGLLGRAGISPTDNFFQLGGHSLLAIETTTAIERDFGVALTPADVFQHPTAGELARLIEQRGGPAARTYAHLFPIQPAGRGTPLIFSVPHFFTPGIAAGLRGERPVYGLRGVGLRPEGNRGRWRTMRDLGAELVDEIRRRFPDGGFLMAGYSFGAAMAVEAVRQMEERGIGVVRLVLIAPMPLDFYRVGPFRVQLEGLRRPVADLSLSQALRRFARTNHPLTRRPYRRARRLLAVQPWRRLLCLVGRLRRLAGWPLTPRILHADVRLERFRLHAGYRPGVVRAPTVLFNAREPETDAAATWRPYFAGPFAVHQIPDPHLDEAAIAEVEELLLQQLGD